MAATTMSFRLDRVSFVSGVSLEFQSGSMNVPLGPTLAGKTTLISPMAAT